jgi:DeoR/GlpR family transcriptional regulator of sugar metabolism
MQHQENRMLTRQRKQLILEELGAEGQVQSKALSILFDVSEDTIRRDLRELAAEGRLQRVHGGALPSSSAIAPFAERQSVKMDAKKGGRKGAQLISSGQVVIIDGGTTTSELITFFPPDLRITVVTHSEYCSGAC